MSKLDPKDGKNFESKSFERHCQSSGDMDSIHGMSNFQITTQEAQTLGFYADTGQGKGGQGGPGTGKFVLNTPGMALEVLGQGLKVRDEGDITQLPAKQTVCKRGDYGVTCENGDVVIKARNITLDACGGGNKDGQIFITANRLVDVRGPDVKIQGEKFTCRATQECDIVTNGFMKMQSAFKVDAQKADDLFGSMSGVLKSATSLNIPQVGEKLDAIADKGKGFAEKIKGTAGKLEGIAEGLAENVDTEAIDQSFSQVEGNLESGDVGAAVENIQDALSGLLGGLG